MGCDLGRVYRRPNIDSGWISAKIDVRVSLSNRNVSGQVSRFVLVIAEWLGPEGCKKERAMNYTPAEYQSILALARTVALAQLFLP